MLSQTPYLWLYKRLENVCAAEAVTHNIDETTLSCKQPRPLCETHLRRWTALLPSNHPPTAVCGLPAFWMPHITKRGQVIVCAVSLQAYTKERTALFSRCAAGTAGGGGGEQATATQRHKLNG
jgi:hypothetical protein